jgi:hypothetical protein
VARRRRPSAAAALHPLHPPPNPTRPRKTIKKSGPGFAYGFITAMCLVLSFFVFLCGLVLDGFRDVVTNELEVKRERRGRGEWSWG